jgi:hypothetical protein
VNVGKGRHAGEPNAVLGDPEKLRIRIGLHLGGVQRRCRGIERQTNSGRLTAAQTVAVGATTGKQAETTHRIGFARWGHNQLARATAYEEAFRLGGQEGLGGPGPAAGAHADQRERQPRTPDAHNDQDW